METPSSLPAGPEPLAQRYSARGEGPREGQRRISPAGSEQVFHEHRWHNIPQSESTVFASPNVGPGMSLAEARRKLRSAEHHRVKQVFVEIARGEGIEPQQVHDAIGMWQGGAENSILLEFGPVPWQKLLVAAAKMGLAARQEGVAVFQEDPEEIYGRWTVLFRGSAEDVASPLVEHGITNWTIVESKGTMAIVVCDQRKTLRRIARELNPVLRPVRSVVVPGRFQLISGKTRAKASQLFRRIIETGEQAREQMAAKEEKPWFLEDLSNASPKVRAWAEIMRRGYEFRQLPIEEQKRQLAEVDEDLRRMGILFERPTGLSTVEGSGQAADATPDQTGQPTAERQEPQ